MAGKKTAFSVKWLDNNSWSTWLEKSGNFVCLESGNPVLCGVVQNNGLLAT